MSSKKKADDFVYDGEVDLEAEEVLDRRGNRIDIAYIEDAVAEAHRTVGRPSLTGEPAPSPHVSFRVSPQLRDLAQDRAKREGKSVSTLAREALEQYLRAA
jgi:hypothetical protein